jgi:hypothetical protein
MTCGCRCAAAVLLAFAAEAPAIDDRAEAARGEAPASQDGTTYKLTPTYYRTTSQPDAYDLNLRGNRDAHTFWVGYYRRHEEFQQLRLGYENSLQIPFGRVVPSIQYASRGFLGGSVTAEIGERHFGLLGWGRTNLRDYYNLNFDPNDSVLVGAGTRALPRTTLSAFQIRDDRLGTGQRVTHFVMRAKPDEKTRWTVDVFHKRDAEDVRGTGASVTYDFGPHFARVASDPHVNFTRDHMVRVALGTRF